MVNKSEGRESKGNESEVNESAGKFPLSTL